MCTYKNCTDENCEHLHTVHINFEVRKYSYTQMNVFNIIFNSHFIRAHINYSKGVYFRVFSSRKRLPRRTLAHLVDICRMPLIIFSITGATFGASPQSLPSILNSLQSCKTPKFTFENRLRTRLHKFVPVFQ